jgi:hypothetical protein
MNGTDTRLVALDELSELRPTPPAAQSHIRNTGLTPLTRGTTARQQEREARRRYQAAIVAGRESLRRAEERFDASSGAIDTHIQQALAADARRGIACPLQAAANPTARPPSSPPRAARASISAARATLSPVPSRSLA